MQMSDKRYRMEDRGYKTPCWIWQGRLNRSGYGPYRSTYIKHRGQVPRGLQLDHVCRVRACCNPDHLQPVTPQENIRRKHPYVRDGGLTDTEPAFWLSPQALARLHSSVENTGMSQAQIIEMSVREFGATLKRQIEKEQ